ncbi:uncharacterized protein LOC142531030 [Primulina tabacum]|uniref:uncharacterized protein LOC142531030 n=1 Tax=Primulina tabacum TaxID=48773 RepID=UPI003F592F71
MKDDREAIFVVRKGNLMCLRKLKLLSGSSWNLVRTKVTPCRRMQRNFLSCGLVNALYSIRTSDLTEELFGTLHSYAFQEAVGPMLTSNDSSRKHLKLDPNGVDQNSSASLSCTLEFDGSSKGNPGQAWVGAIIRSDDGSLDLNYEADNQANLGVDLAGTSSQGY